MKIKEIFNLAIKKGIEADFRSQAGINKLLERKRKKYQELPEAKKKFFVKDFFFGEKVNKRSGSVWEVKTCNFVFKKFLEIRSLKPHFVDVFSFLRS